jgi:hypothetical protein
LLKYGALVAVAVDRLLAQLTLLAVAVAVVHTITDYFLLLILPIPSQ